MRRNVLNLSAGINITNWNIFSG